MEANIVDLVQRYIKSNPRVKRWVLWMMRVADSIRFGRFPATIGNYGRFFRDWRRFEQAGGKASIGDFWPCLFDRTTRSHVDTHYFYQALWAFKRISNDRPKSHIDVGSEVHFVGLLTTITAVTFVDIRPLELDIPNYSGKRGSMLELPFEAGSIESFSSLHVIEHIGLGRYGDPIDPNGSIKAAREIVRVLAPGGRVYISVPIGRSRVQFNGQRVFSVADVLALFNGLDLVEMAMVDASGVFREDVTPESAHVSEIGYGSDFGLGLFCLQKRA